MTFAEHAIAQVLREIADEIQRETSKGWHFVSDLEMIDILNKIAQKLSPKPPGEK